ncbi:MAG TPA: glycosyltransferase family 39 protein, partial [Blastocatellia bacterium]|nr:glycosyltransferase family 39 protein [Blastocatellia bacterium]
MKRSRLLGILPVILLILYCGFLIRNAWYAVAGSDSTGYVSFARSMAAGEIVKPVVELNRLELPNDFTDVFMPLGSSHGPRPGTIAPMYPIGLPLHLALGGLLGGWEYGPFLVNPIIAGLSLILIYLIGLELGLPRRFSATGAVMLAVHPTFLYFAMQPMSDGASACWALVAIWTSLRSRQRDWWGLFAGAALGAAFLVRPSNVLLSIPMLFSLRLKPRVLLLCCLGGLPFAGAFLIYNTVAYGHPLTTGYAVTIPTNHQGQLMWANLSVRFNYYVDWLQRLIGPLAVLGWLGVAACRNL